MKKNNRAILYTLLIMSVMLFQTICAETAFAAAELSEDELWKQEPAYGTTIDIDYTGSLCTSPIALADALGFYEEEGIKVSATPNINTVEMVGTGKIKAAVDHITYLMVPAVNGVGLVFTTACNVGCKSLYVLTDSGINSTSDLVGKTVAIPAGYGSYDHNIALRFFQRDGIGTKEVNYKAVESAAAILAMRNGEIDGAILSDQYACNFVKDGTLRYVRSITWDDDFKEEPCCVLTFNRDFYERNPVTVLKMTRAIQKAKEWMHANPEQAAQILLDKSLVAGDVNIIIEMINAFNFAITDAQCEIALRNVIEDYKTFELIPRDTDTEEIMTSLWHPLLTGK